MAICLDFEGIKGNVTAEGFEQCVEIHSVKFGVKRSIIMEAGKMEDREVGKPTLSTVALTKTADNSVATLFKTSFQAHPAKRPPLTLFAPAATRSKHS